MPFPKGLVTKYHMRPMCSACKQRSCAINYHRDDRVYYRNRCEQCIRKKKKIKPQVPKWQTAGYKKKPTCDHCGFKAKYSAQLWVYHVDGDLHNCDHRNLKTVCMNCTAALTWLDLPWKLGDLEIIPDR